MAVKKYMLLCWLFGISSGISSSTVPVISAKSGSTVRLACSTDNVASRVETWQYMQPYVCAENANEFIYLNGRINPARADRFSLGEDGQSLVISDVSINDSGTYTCVRNGDEEAVRVRFHVSDSCDGLHNKTPFVLLLSGVVSSIVLMIYIVYFILYWRRRCIRRRSRKTFVDDSTSVTIPGSVPFLNMTISSETDDATSSEKKQNQPGSFPLMAFSRQMSSETGYAANGDNQHNQPDSELGELCDRLRLIIEPDYGLLDELLSSDALTFEHVNRIRSQPDVYSRNDLLLKCIIYENKKYLLTEALKKVNQQYVVNAIKQSEGTDEEFGKRLPLDAEHLKQLKSSYSQLMADVVNVEDPLVEELEACGCINSQEKDALKSGRRRFDRVRLLLDLLVRKSIEDYNKFADCLVKVGLGNLSKCLRSLPTK